jgi:hypothetical protein
MSSRGSTKENIKSNKSLTNKRKSKTKSQLSLKKSLSHKTNSQKSESLKKLKTLKSKKTNSRKSVSKKSKSKKSVSKKSLKDGENKPEKGPKGENVEDDDDDEYDENGNKKKSSKTLSQVTTYSVMPNSSLNETTKNLSNQTTDELLLMNDSLDSDSKYNSRYVLFNF